MGKLEDQMLFNMQLRNLSSRTIGIYLWHMRKYTQRFGRSPDLLGEPEIRQYLHYMREERKVSWSNINIAYSALKFFYVNTLHREWDIQKIPRPKSERRLPVVLSSAEVGKLLTNITNQKHRAILMTIYSAGLRLSEGAHLKIMDIDSERMQLRVEQGKGKRDRYSLLSERLLKELRNYWRAYRPTIWLFPGNKNDRPINVGTIQKAFQQAKKKPIFKSHVPSILFAIALPPTY